MLAGFPASAGQRTISCCGLWVPLRIHLFFSGVSDLDVTSHELVELRFRLRISAFQIQSFFFDFDAFN